MSLALRALALLFCQAVILVMGAALLGHVYLAPLTVLISGLSLMQLRWSADQAPQLLPRDVAEQQLLAQLSDSVRSFAARARLRTVPRVSLIRGEAPPHVVRLGRPRILIGTVLAADTVAGRFDRDELEALLAHEVAHLIDPGGPISEVVSTATRLMGVVVLGAMLLDGGSDVSAVSLALVLACVVAGNLVAGARRRTDELLADQRATRLMGDGGDVRLAQGLRSYTRHQISSFVELVLQLGHPRPAALMRDNLRSDYAALGDARELAERYEAMENLARDHSPSLGQIIGGALRDLRYVLMRGGSSHPGLAQRLKRLSAAE